MRRGKTTKLKPPARRGTTTKVRTAGLLSKAAKRRSTTMTVKPSGRDVKAAKMEESLADGRRVLEIEARAVQSLVDRLDAKFAKAVDLLVQCKGKVVVSGMGKSGLIGQKMAATLASTGTSSFFLHPAEGVHGDLGMLARRDALVAISNSGETQELLQLLPYVKRLGIPVIAFTGRMNSTLAKNADVVLDVSVQEEACPMGLAPTASTTATLALGDALAVALLQKREFKEEDFARFHPGGTLGRRLLIKVKDLMHADGEIPMVQTTVGGMAAMLEMSAKKLGMTTVVDQEGLGRCDHRRRLAALHPAGHGFGQHDGRRTGLSQSQNDRTAGIGGNRSGDDGTVFDHDAGGHGRWAEHPRRDSFA
jgi:arabinose-5-phosphate isomerase